MPLKVKKFKGLDIYIPPLTGKPWPAAVYNWSGVLTGNDTRWRSASSVHPLPEWTDSGPRSLSAARQTHLCPSQPHYRLQPAMFSGNDSL